jgi:hypothetical protein
LPVKPCEAHPVPDIDWVALGLMVATVLLAVLYGLAVSGHFPAEFRQPGLRRGWGALVLWGTMAATALAAGTAGVLGWRALPWYATVIGAGAALLLAPLLLQPLPDSFVNGRRGLLMLAAGSALLAALLWHLA